ncbi:hypothetical protein SEA_NERGAL_43 [Mycobacterium Phage Nergal]|nr:hypothetical protein SEA_NERGAL_43 [Mycobacterium Phage Nergal]
MQLAYHIAAITKVRRERDDAIAERDAARRVVAELTDQLNDVHRQRAEQVGQLHEQIAELDAAHRAAIADIDAMIAAANERGQVITYAEPPRTLHGEPDMDRCG